MHSDKRRDPNLNQITLPPIVKQVLAPQNDFGMQKITCSNYKRSGIWEDPPPPMFFKIPTFSCFVFLRASLLGPCQTKTLLFGTESQMWVGGWFH